MASVEVKTGPTNVKQSIADSNLAHTPLLKKFFLEVIGGKT